MRQDHGKLLGPLGLILFPAIVFTAAILVDEVNVFREFKSATQTRRIPPAMLRYGQAGKMAQIFELKNRSRLQLEGFDMGLSPGELPSSAAFGDSVRANGFPTLSLVVDENDLYHPRRGIVANPGERGAKWERPAYMTYYENGELLFATGAGIRLHGGKARYTWPKSYRLYFKNVYGASHFKPGILFGGAGDPMGVLVVHGDVRRGGGNGKTEYWQFMNPLAYDIAREIGCLAPLTKPIQLYLNGEYQGAYVLTQYIDRHFLRARFGHDKFVMVRSKRGRGSPDPLKMGDPQKYRDFVTWHDEIMPPFTMAKAAEVIDVDNFSRWLLSIAYCGTTDPFQGTIILDETRQDARWRLINWDMDHSFMDFYHKARVPWEIDLFDFVLNYPTYERAGYGSWPQRAVIFRRLVTEDPVFRSYFKQLMTRVMNHKLTDSFLETRIRYYEMVAVNLGIDDRGFIGTIKEFVKHRPEMLREQMKIHFDAGPSYSCQLVSKSPATFEIDGSRVDSGYKGWYFEGTPIRVRILDSDKDSFAYWRVNGQTRRDFPVLEVVVNGETLVEAVLSEKELEL